MQTIQFVTSNKGKILSLSQQLDASKYRVVQCELNVPEIQANNIENIVRFKAKYAHSKLKDSLVVQDSGVFVNALNGFPGPYFKYIEETIGVESLLDFMRDQSDRSCAIIKSTAYVDGGGNVHVFSSTLRGTIADELGPASNARAWSNLWRIYVPEGYNATLSTFNAHQMEQWECSTETSSDFAQLAGLLDTQIG